MRAIAAACCLLMGCLITEKKEFPALPDCPPSIETETLETAEHPLGTVIVLDLAEPAGDSGTGGSDLQFQVHVRDCNEDQDLVMRVFSTATLPSTRSIQSLPVPSEQRNPFTFPVSRDTFIGKAGSCQNIEVRVSEAFEFESALEREPIKPGDLGTAIWWVAVIDSSNPIPENLGVEMVLCP